MNSTQYIRRPASCLKRMLKWPLLCGLLCLTIAQLARAADSLYQNDAVINYPGNVSAPPVIDATNFVNTGTFIINFTTLGITQPFYETSDTVNYTNTGLMMANTGFRFDNQPSSTGTRTASGSFYNTGMVSCGSTNNLTDPFGGTLYLNSAFLGNPSYFPQCIISASNIVNPGNIDLGFGGMAQLSGHNLDLSRSTIQLEDAPFNVIVLSSIFGTSPYINNAYVSGTGTFGLNTNYWDPFVFLGANYAESAFFPIPPYYLSLTNSQSYFNFASSDGGTNIVIRVVFVQDNSGPDVDYNVYFGTAGIGFGSGNATVEWEGTYLDAATGSTKHNYLYLNTDYVRGTATNLFFISGIPDNFQFTESSTRIPIGVAPTPAGFYNVFSDIPITNRYSFADAQLIPSSASVSNVVNHSVTNLPGRVQFSASDTLDLTDAKLTGVNYLNVQSPKQFNGSAGAVIQSAYSDFNLGVTNGFLTITNLVSPGLANWSGEVQAWSTRWLEGNALGGTNDFRVVIIGSQLSPTALAQIQDMVLHGTNSITISDKLNIMRTFTADAQNLTLTTNQVGVGATSLDGELNVASPNIYWASSLPNLRNLTNNGAIRFQNLSQFMGVSNAVSVIPAVAATGTLSEVPGHANAASGNFVQLGTQGYYFVSKLTNSLANRILIASSFDGTMSNLMAAINGDAGAGTKYSSSTAANSALGAGPLSNHALTVFARVAGVSGNTNYVAMSTATTNNLVWSGIVPSSPFSGYLSGGADAVAGSANINVPYDNFINHGWVSANGSAIWADHFENSGMISNGPAASFNLNSVTAVLTNGTILAGGDIVINATNSLETSNTVLQAGRSITLAATNLLTDDGVTNGNIWSVRTGDTTGGNGLIATIKPAQGDLLGTTITNFAAAPNKLVANIWPGQDRSVSSSGYTNNLAVGRLILNAAGTYSTFSFTGASVSNALYVDYLELQGAFTNGIYHSYDFSDNLSIAGNIVIYYGDVVINGVSVAAKVDEASRAGRNNGRLRWVPSYAGYYSSKTVVYPDGTTNTFNAALLGSTTLDSNGNGIPNASDPTPIFTSSQVKLQVTIVTNNPPAKAAIQWNSIPGSTNTVYYSTNFATAPNIVLTNFVSPSLVPPAGGWPITNIVIDPMQSMRFYGVKVEPNTTMLYGP